jgi:hypothetical protein
LFFCLKIDPTAEHRHYGLTNLIFASFLHSAFTRKSCQVELAPQGKLSACIVESQQYFVLAPDFVAYHISKIPRWLPSNGFNPITDSPVLGFCFSVENKPFIDNPLHGGSATVLLDSFLQVTWQLLYALVNDPSLRVAAGFLLTGESFSYFRAVRPANGDLVQAILRTQKALLTPAALGMFISKDLDDALEPIFADVEYFDLSKDTSHRYKTIMAKCIAELRARTLIPETVYFHQRICNPFYNGISPQFGNALHDCAERMTHQYSVDWDVETNWLHHMTGRRVPPVTPLLQTQITIYNVRPIAVSLPLLVLTLSSGYFTFCV